MDPEIEVREYFLQNSSISIVTEEGETNNSPLVSAATCTFRSRSPVPLSHEALVDTRRGLPWATLDSQPSRTAVDLHRNSLDNVAKINLPIQRLTWSRKLGWYTTFILVFGTFVILSTILFLSYLWYGNHSDPTWQQLMAANWSIRSISLASLALRMAAGFQAGACTSMLASLALEHFIVPLPATAAVSTMRSSQPSPYSLVVAFFMSAFWPKIKQKKWLIRVPFLTVALVVLTTLLQFTSTALLSDLQANSVPGFNETTLSAFDLNQSSGYFASSPSSWELKPALYPTFAEYSEQPFIAPGVSDTGLTLRAFLPFDSVQTRQNIRNFSGKAYVLDSRVTCQQPILRNETVTYTGGGLAINGSLSASANTPRLRNASYPTGNGSSGLVSFSCVVMPYVVLPNDWPITLCQLIGTNPFAICRI
jgi:hypothetical protein